ncbi:hypothetical protein IPA_05735 [Ignicoccus pacificus DSM 13166]|uniref:Uncharacterized protein n=1 Tax=Ignicoccus pacificus DSM 13166 TaxID=940294 RepID=A0A977PK61_9CREN|nr:hypothetical protein IPA_05735 [Ignicoccus pacificus DSM 13166]
MAIVAFLSTSDPISFIYFFVVGILAGAIAFFLEHLPYFS